MEELFRISHNFKFKSGQSVAVICRACPALQVYYKEFKALSLKRTYPLYQYSMGSTDPKAVHEIIVLLHI